MSPFMSLPKETRMRSSGGMRENPSANRFHGVWNVAMQDLTPLIYVHAGRTQ